MDNNNPQVQQPISPQPIPPQNIPEKTNRFPKRVLLIGGLAILIILVGAGGYYLGTKKNNSNPTIPYNQPIVSPSPTSIPSPSATPIPTSAFPNIDGTIPCQTNKDCPSDYYCTQSGPIKYNPVTKKASPGLTCWKNGDMVPM